MQEKSIHSSPNRNYRSLLSQEHDEQQIRLSIEESDLLISLSSSIKKEIILPFIQSELYSLRAEIKAYITQNPLFKSSLLPLKQDAHALPLIQDMLFAGKCSQIGPFSAVAGTVAEHLARRIHTFIEKMHISSDIIVENGGDIFLMTSKERTVAIVDKPIQGVKFGVKLQANNTEKLSLALCSSSSNIGHSLSFGNADLVLIIAKKGSIADTFATAACNMLKSEKDFEKVLKFIKKNQKHGIIGLFSSCNNEIMAYGDIELCAL